ncbi:MAG: MerR family transcriptional regulator [Cytophagales bacterium]|nr:MerR family transcriptional regulator [Cytophagales bacterium]
MGYYSIKDLEVLSGIKAHTLRIWEQRYSIISPKRTDTNIRLYDDSDLKLILNISLLNQNGYKISKIAEMSNDDLGKEVVQITEKNLKFPEQVHSLTLSMIEYDEERFEKILSKNILQYGFEKTMIHVVYPFLNKIGILWLAGSVNPAQEHFISNLIRQKLIVAIDGQTTPVDPLAKKFIFFLPEGELHEIGLLFSLYLTKADHNKVLYLGQSLPLEDLVSADKIFSADYIFTAFTSNPHGLDIQAYLNDLSVKFPHAQILVTGYQIIGQDYEFPHNVIPFLRIEQFIDFLKQS